MAAAASGHLRGKGPSKAVASEFLAATPKAAKSRFAKAKRPKKG